MTAQNTNSVSRPHQAAIQVWLQGGSVCRIPLASLALCAANRVALPGISAETHLREQILPLFTAEPQAALEVAKSLDWCSVCAIACNACWQAPVDCLGAYWPDAKLALVS